MYHVDITNKGDYHFDVKSKEYEFAVDTKGNGMTPPDVLLASIGTCIGVYLRKYAEGAKLSLPEFTVKVDADFSKDKPVCFRQIKVEIDLKGTKVDDRRIKAILEFVKNCPVHNTVKTNPEIEVAIK